MISVGCANLMMVITTRRHGLTPTGRSPNPSEGHPVSGRTSGTSSAVVFRMLMRIPARRRLMSRTTLSTRAGAVMLAPSALSIRQVLATRIMTI
ncbi:hypothetical protein DPMN_007512 [Dreissena polymorpha]|uniref:Uncharacterized protein n=1 Tax=Dreissena polymorpha TaxID=45954 RepID=A0A9D4MWC3_DREPO|nr:hypothetical protein DPMN_007512 [Dreissena polymorpha]